MANVHVGDVGTVFRLTFKDQDGVVVDISSASVKQVVFTKPTGAKLACVATFTTSGVDGAAQYASISGDIDLAGTWSMDGYVELPAGKWHSDKVSFEVLAN